MMQEYTDYEDLPDFITDYIESLEKWSFSCDHLRKTKIIWKKSFSHKDKEYEIHWICDDEKRGMCAKWNDNGTWEIDYIFNPDLDIDEEFPLYVKTKDAQ